MANQTANVKSSLHQSCGPKVAIIGAGLTGMIAAHGLKKNGFEVTVFERDASIDARPRDWTILIHWGMSTLIELLPEHIAKNLPKSFCNPHLDFNEWDESVAGYNGVTGDLLFSNPTPGSRRVSRHRFRKVLVEGLAIRWGKRLRQMTAESNSVELIFEDGDKYEADYVLGTDGASSKVRELLMGTEAARPVPSGFLIANCICKYGDADRVNAIVKAHPVCALMLGSGSLAGCGVMSVDDPKDTSTWETFWVKVWRGHSVNLQGKEAIEYAKGDMSSLCEPFRSAMEWTPEGSSCHLDEMKYWLPSRWETHDGRVTLAGDAAHPMLPFRGQGLQHAIVDANNYINALKELRDASDTLSRKETMTAYSADVVERGSKAVAQALREAEYSLDSNTVGKMLMVTQGHKRLV